MTPEQRAGQIIARAAKYMPPMAVKIDLSELVVAIADAIREAVADAQVDERKKVKAELMVAEQRVAKQERERCADIVTREVSIAPLPKKTEQMLCSRIVQAIRREDRP